MKVFRLYMDYDKEENFLNNMVKSGWAMKSFFLGVYTFERCNPGEYTYRIELLDNLPLTNKSMEYISFVTETGAEYIQSWGRWVYFRKRASGEDFVLYSDLVSKIAHYRKIRLMLGVVALAELTFTINMMTSFLKHGSISALIITIFLLGVTLFIGCGAIKTHEKIQKLSIDTDMNK